MKETLQQFGPPIVAAIVSYYFSVRHTNRTAKEQLVLNRVEALVDKIENTSESASLYYRHSAGSESIAREVILQHQVSMISREVMDLSKQCQILGQEPDTPKCAVIHFRQVITGGQFRSASRQALPAEDSLFTRIIIARDRLVAQLRRLR